MTALTIMLPDDLAATLKEAFPTQADRDAAHRLEVHHARQVLDRVDGASRSRFDEADRRVLPHRDAELLDDQLVHHVDERQADEQDGDGKRDSEDRDERPPRLALQSGTPLAPPVWPHPSQPHLRADRLAG